METHLENEDSHEELYHRPEEHGLIWWVINKFLHSIVLSYSLFGLIHFDFVKFIHMRYLVKSVAFFIISCSCYITLKFALIAMLSFFFNHSLSHMDISIDQLNCNISQNLPVLISAKRLEDNNRAGNYLDGGLNRSVRGGNKFPCISYDTVIAQGYLVERFVGPYKSLGDMTTVLYGFFSIAVCIMLAIFPIELFYANVGFNYIRFVLSDANVMRDLYERKQALLTMLDSMPQNQINSPISGSLKRTMRQLNLKCMEELRPIKRNGLIDNILQIFPILHSFDLRSAAKTWPSFDRSTTNQVYMPIQSIRHPAKMNTINKTSYEVKVAHENLNKFKPHVRSEAWFKATMVLYPCFMVYNFTVTFLIINELTIYLDSVLQTKCSGQEDSFQDWSFMDKLLHVETRYTVFLLSFGASFYTSYYFGTIVELYVWIQEIFQQLDLCKVMAELSPHSLIGPPLVHAARRPILVTRSQVKDNPLINAMFDHHSMTRGDIEPYYNEFGGIKSFWKHVSSLNSKQSMRLRKQELMGFMLLSKKQTVMRAAYLNLNLFLKEVNDTRFMITTILRRTIQLAVSFALLVSLTRSQFAANYIRLSMMLVITMIVLNLYLITAAWLSASVSGP